MISSGSIGVFDSGVGGLNTLRLLEQKFPNENFIYFADNANLPYGDKTQDEITKFSKNIINFLISKGVKLIVVACNTSSALSIQNIKHLYDIPIIDIITPITCEISKHFKKIGLIATHGTVSSNAYLNELKKCNLNIELIQISCPKLVPIVENNKIHDVETKEILIEYLKPITERNDIEAIIYGCTHYQYLDHVIKKIIKKDIKILNPIDFIYNCVKAYISNEQTNNTKKRKTEYYASGCKEQFLRSAKLFSTNNNIFVKRPLLIQNSNFLESKNFFINKLNNFNILYFKNIDSTNNKAAKIAQINKKYQKPIIIIAENQKSGRGKSDSKWISNKNNIAFTMLYQINSSPDLYNNFSLLVGLSLLETIIENKNEKNFDIKIKYPNDILINQKKVAGILIDIHRFKNQNWIAVGVGINWDYSPLKTSKHISDLITISKNQFILELIKNIDSKIKNPIDFKYHNSINSNLNIDINLGQYYEKIIKNLTFERPEL